MSVQQLALFGPMGMARAHADGTVWADQPGDEPVNPRRINGCTKCLGTGEYKWGAMINGVPSKHGVCYACKGKGFQTDADERRNNYYWDHVDLSSLL